MRKALSAIVLSSVMVLAFAGCHKPQAPAAPESKPSTTPTAAPAAGTTAPAANLPPTKPVPVDQYWDIQIQRLEATKKHYEAILAVYTKYKGDTPEARNEVMELQRKDRDAMQEIFKSHGFSAMDFYPRGPDRRDILTQRQQYLQTNPQLKDKYQALAKDIRDLREKVKAFLPAPPPGAMPTGAPGAMPPGHPPVNGLPGQPGMTPMPGMPAGHPPVSTPPGPAPVSPAPAPSHP